MSGSYSLNLFLIKDNVVTFDFIIENSDNFSFLSEARNAPFIVVDKSQLNIISSKAQKHELLVHTSSEKDFKGTTVNMTCHSIDGVSFEVPFTVPLKGECNVN